MDEPVYNGGLSREDQDDPTCRNGDRCKECKSVLKYTDGDMESVYNFDFPETKTRDLLRNVEIVAEDENCKGERWWFDYKKSESNQQTTEIIKKGGCTFEICGGVIRICKTFAENLFLNA
jgi:hypothetical protein